MKKSSNNPVFKSAGDRSVQPWSPAAVQQPKQIEPPAFLIQSNPQEQSRGREGDSAVIKSGETQTNPFSTWVPTNVLDREDWIQSNPPSGAPTIGQVPGWAAGSPLINNPSQAALNPESERMQKLIHQAQEQAEKQVLQEQEQRLKSVKTEAQQILNTAENVLEEIQQLRDEMIANSEESILNLVLDISRALFADGISLEKEVLEKVVLDALTEAKELGNLTLHLHPEDQKLLDPHWPENLLGSGTELKILPDPQIERGGCFLDGEYGQVDARVSTKIKEICSALQDVHLNHSNPTDPDTAG